MQIQKITTSFAQNHNDNNNNQKNIVQNPQKFIEAVQKNQEFIQDLQKYLNKCQDESHYQKIVQIYFPNYSDEILQVKESQVNNYIYIGQLNEQNQKHGKGIVIYNYKNKSKNVKCKVFQGEWVNNKKNGKGIQINDDGTMYEGNFKDNFSNGLGKFLWKSGEIYEGEWKNGQKEGSGVWVGCLKGDFYTGEWKNDKPNGFGIHYWSNGGRYEGQFQDCVKHGYGKEDFPNGDVYIGYYQNGQSHGQGEYFFNNKSYYKGEFQKGKREGFGIWKQKYTQEDKVLQEDYTQEEKQQIEDIETCTSYKSKLAKKQNNQFNHGDYYEGQYQNDQKNGYGIFKWESGNYYQGEFQDNFRHGLGKMVWKNGSYYYGYWKKGQQIGIGELYNSQDGKQYGYYENQQFIVEKDQDKINEFLKQIEGQSIQQNASSENLQSKFQSTNQKDINNLQDTLQKYQSNKKLNNNSQYLDEIIELKENESCNQNKNKKVLYQFVKLPNLCQKYNNTKKETYKLIAIDDQQEVQNQLQNSQNQNIINQLQNQSKFSQKYPQNQFYDFEQQNENQQYSNNQSYYNKIQKKKRQQYYQYNKNYIKHNIRSVSVNQNSYKQHQQLTDKQIESFTRRSKHSISTSLDQNSNNKYNSISYDIDQRFCKNNNTNLSILSFNKQNSLTLSPLKNKISTNKPTVSPVKIYDKIRKQLRESERRLNNQQLQSLIFHEQVKKSLKNDLDIVKQKQIQQLNNQQKQQKLIRNKTKKYKDINTSCELPKINNINQSLYTDNQQQQIKNIDSYSNQYIFQQNVNNKSNKIYETIQI